MPSAKEDLATQLFELAAVVTARVQSLAPDVTWNFCPGWGVVARR